MTGTPGAIPSSSLDLQDRAFVADPYPHWRELRELAPIVFHEGLGQYFVTRWAGCADVLGNPHRYIEDTAMARRFFGGDSMKGVDGPPHEMMRGIWAEDFRRSTSMQRRSMITDIVDSQLMPFVQALTVGGTALDAVSGAIRTIPMLVIANLLGIPEGDHGQFIEWSERMLGVAAGAANDSPEAEDLVASGIQATAEMNGYLRDQYYARGGSASTDLIGRLIGSPKHNQLCAQDRIASLTQLGFAGNETTPKLMATTLYVLARFPDQRRLLQEDRSLIPQAVDEINRWSTPAQVNWRIVKPGSGDCDIEGLRVPEGNMLLCLEGAANRDPSRWPEPDTFNIMRPQLPNMGFGYGRHTCLGIHLAKLEVQVWLERLLGVLPDWTVHAVDWGTAWVARGPVRIEIGADIEHACTRRLQAPNAGVNRNGAPCQATSLDSEGNLLKRER